MIEKNRQMGADLAKQILSLKHGVQHAIETLQKRPSQPQIKNSKSSPDATHKARTATDVCDEREALAVTLAQCDSIASDLIASLALLDSLPFEQLDFRHSKIQTAHSGTLEWVFATTWTSWVESSDPIFWVSGKPGSGKSTLMKYLVHNSRSHLATAQNYVFLDYFFWVGGTELQRSQEGLLRALLYDILRHSPRLIKPMLPYAWHDVRSQLSSNGAPLQSARGHQEWTRSELLAAFQRLATVEDWDTKLLIFIDGLDEYAGDYEDLIRTICDLTKLDIKVCAASRPWPIFEDAFGADRRRKLYLQDLNKQDMQRYVDDHLTHQPNFLRLEGSQADAIVGEIVEKSQGVFLWVYLVVRSLLEGLRNRDSIPLLRKRLREFPSDLDQFFGYMFLSLEGVYKAHLSHMFQVALTSSQPLSPIAYWHLDQIEDGLDTVLEMPDYVGRAHGIFDMIDDTTVRINGRCKGLLEVTTARDSHWKLNMDAYDVYFDGVELEHVDKIYLRVDFLHRTVRDFFTTTNMRDTLAQWQNSDFNADLAICKMLLAELKQIGFMRWTLKESHILQPVLEEFFDAAQRLEAKSQTLRFAYLDEFERTFARHNRARGGDSTIDPWTFLGCSTFLEVVVMYDLRVFVAQRMAETPLTIDEMEQCVKATFRNDKLWTGNNGRNLGPDGLPEMLTVLLAGRPELEFRDEFQEAVLKRLVRLDSLALVGVLRGLYKHYFIDLNVIGDPDEALHQLVLRTLTWKEYLDVWDFLRRERKTRQSLQSTPTIYVLEPEARAATSATILHDTSLTPMPAGPSTATARRGSSYFAKGSNVLRVETFVGRGSSEEPKVSERAKRMSLRARMKKLAQGLVT
jgi:hypothetical protein